MDVGKLPERDRKIMLWSIVIVLGAVLFLWWGKNVAERLKTLPSFDVEFPQETLEELQQEFDNAKQQE